MISNFQLMLKLKLVNDLDDGRVSVKVIFSLFHSLSLLDPMASLN